MEGALVWVFMALFLVFDGLLLLVWRNRQTAKSFTNKLAETQSTLSKRVDRLDSQLAMVGQAVMPISTAFQTILIKELTHFHTPRMDALLAKLGPPYSLTESEEEELLMALKERELDMGELITPSERDAAHIFPAVMRRAKVEAEAMKDMPLTLRLVTIAATALHDQERQTLIQALMSGLPASDIPELPPPLHRQGVD